MGVLTRQASGLESRLLRVVATNSILPDVMRRWTRRMRRAVGVGTACLGLLASVSAQGANASATSEKPHSIHPLSFGPLVQEFGLTLSSGRRLEALGPLYYEQDIGETSDWAFPPLMSRHVDRGTDSEEFDFLYPLLSYDRFGMEYRLHVFQLLAFSGGANVDGGKRERFQFFPFYLQQRSADDPTRNYTSVLPFYGTMRNKLFRDRIHFVAFPLYVETQKRDVVTRNYVAPFFHIRTGEQLKGWQLWPLYGQEHKSMLTRTNEFGEAEVVPGHDKHFALWPLYSSAHTGIGSANPERSLLVLPFGAWQRSKNRDSTTYLWPFFSYVNDREKGYEEWGSPWPFVVTSKGKGKTGFRFWPIYGHARNESLDSRTVLWPLWRRTGAKSAAYERARTRGVMMLFSDLKEKNLASNQDRHRVDIWPLFSWRREWDGSQRFQALSLVEPFVPTSKSVERNFSHTWSIFRSESDPKSKRSSRSLLWNLYREEKGPESTKRSFLFGLYQCEGARGDQRHRLFYMRFGKGRGSAGAASSEGTNPAATTSPRSP